MSKNHYLIIFVLLTGCAARGQQNYGPIKNDNNKKQEHPWEMWQASSVLGSRELSRKSRDRHSGELSSEF